MSRWGRIGWPWAAVAVVITALFLGFGFVLSAHGWIAVAGLAAIEAFLIAVIGPLILSASMYGRRGRKDDGQTELAKQLNTIADGRGLTTEELCSRLHKWPRSAVDDYLRGLQAPPWDFVNDFISVIARTRWHREALDRKLRPLWQQRGVSPNRFVAFMTVSTIVVVFGLIFVAIFVHGSPPNDSSRARASNSLQTRSTPYSTLVTTEYPPRALAFSPNAKLLAIGSSNAYITKGITYLRDVVTGIIIGKLPDSRAGVNTVTFTRNGRILATGGFDGRTDLWDVSTQTSIAHFDDPGGGGVQSIAFSRSGQLLAVGGFNGTIYLWNVTTGTLIKRLSDPGGLGGTSVVFSPNGKILAAGDLGGKVYLWDVVTRTIIKPLPEPGGKGVSSVAFSPNGKILAAGDLNGTTYLWDVATATIIKPLPGGKGVSSVAFSPNGKILAAGDLGGKVYLWDAATGTIIKSLHQIRGRGVSSVAFSPNGKILAVGGNNSSTYLLDMTSPRS